MSHHLDSPLARRDPRLDVTDLYVFRGERGTVLVSNHSHSLAGDDIPRGFHPEGRYEFKVDVNGDTVEELTYRFVFEGPDSTGTQEYRLIKLLGAEAADPGSEGAVIGGGRTGASVDVAGGGRMWAGEASDPFWIEPTVLRAVGEAFHAGTTIDLGDWTPAQAINLFAGHTVHSIVLEVPDDEWHVLTDRADPTVGVWALASLATDAGGWRPINRAGLPMIHPLFTQFDEDLGDALNTTLPVDDRRLYASRLAAMIAAVVHADGTAAHSAAYADLIVDRLLPNILPYTIGTTASFTFAGWNGRTLSDNAPDVMFSLAANTPVSLGLGHDSVSAQPTPSFPHVSPASRHQ